MTLLDLSEIHSRLYKKINQTCEKQINFWLDTFEYCDFLSCTPFELEDYLHELCQCGLIARMVWTNDGVYDATENRWFFKKHDVSIREPL